MGGDPKNLRFLAEYKTIFWVPRKTQNNAQFEFWCIKIFSIF